MPRYKKKKHNRLLGAPKSRVKPNRSVKGQSEDIKMTPHKSKKSADNKGGMRVIAGKKPEKGRKAKSLTLIIAFVLAVVLLFQALLPAGLFQTALNLLAVVGTGSYPISVSGGETLNVSPVGNYYYVLTDTHISAFSSAGKTLFSESHGFEKPVLKVSKAKAMVYGQGEKNFLIVDTRGIKKDIETENSIICTAVSDSGYYAVATYSANYASQVTVYSKTNKKIYEWFSASETINNVALSSSGKKLALSTFNSVSGVLNSKLNILNYKSATPEYTANYDNGLIYGIDSSNKFNFTVIKSNGVDTVKWSNKKTNAYNDEYSISLFRNNASVNVAVFNRNSDNTDNKIVILSKSGKVKATVKYNGVIKDIRVKGRNIYCLSETDVSVLDFKGNVKTVCDYGFGGIGLSVASANVAIIVTDNDVKRIKLTEKG